MRVLLVFPPVDSDGGKSYRTLPMGPLLVASALKRAGFQAELHDAAFDSDHEEAVMQKVAAEDFLFVGLSVMTSQVGHALSLSKRIKEARPGLKIVWGGFHPTLFPQQTVAHPAVDIAVIDEGERAAVQIARALTGDSSLEQAEGICFKMNGEVHTTAAGPRNDFANLPMIDYSLVDVERYVSQPLSRLGAGHPPRRSLPLLTGLGCKYRCAFCINHVLRREYRVRPASEIVASAAQLVERYGVEDFNFVDEHFFGDPSRVTEFLSLKLSSGMQFTWDTNARANDFAEKYLNVETLKRLKDSGLSRVGIGAESGSQRVLNYISKGTKVEQISNAAVSLALAELNAAFSFMVGLPGETKEEYDLTYRLCNEILDSSPASTIIGPQLFRPYPGSRLYEEATRDYALTVPANLEEWATFASQDGYFEPEQLPWVKQPRAIRLRAFYLDRRKAPAGGRSPLKAVGKKLFRASAAFRLRHDLYFLPLEYYLYRSFKKLSSG